MSRQLDCLFRTARVLTGSTAAAEDLVQETAVRACSAWNGLRSIASAKTWLLRILHHTFLNDRRAARRAPPLIELDVADLALHPFLAQEPAQPFAPLSDELSAALASLHPAFREALWLVEVEELTFAEAAEVLAVPWGTVASRVHRARRLVREQLARTAQGTP